MHGADPGAGLDGTSGDGTGTYSHSISGDVVPLAVLDHLLQVRAVVGLAVRYHDHHFLGSFPPAFLKGLRAETAETRGRSKQAADA